MTAFLIRGLIGGATGYAAAYVFFMYLYGVGSQMITDKAHASNEAWIVLVGASIGALLGLALAPSRTNLLFCTRLFGTYFASILLASCAAHLSPGQSNRRWITGVAIYISLIVVVAALSAAYTLRAKTTSGS